MMQFIRNNHLTIVLFTVFICFKQVWEDLANKLIINPIISKFECNFTTTCLWVIGICIIFYTTQKEYRRRKALSDKTIGLSIVTLCIWGWYRFTTNTAYHIPYWKTLCYVDIIPIICIAKLYIHFIHKPIKLQEKNNEGFIIDTPITRTEEDLLNRAIDAKDAATKLISTDTSEKAFTFGIVAQWGEGKTSFMYLMEEYLRSCFDFIR